MRLSIRSFLIGFVLLGTLLSCEDHRLTIEGKRYRLKEYTTAVGRTLTTRQFTYNANNQLSTLLTYYGPPSPTAPQVVTAYEYNSAGKLVVAQDQSAINYSGDRTRIEYSYDLAGNLIMIKQFRAPANTTAFVQFATRTFEYANSVLPTRSTLQSDFGSNGTVEFTFLNGNISKEVFTPTDSGPTSTAFFGDYDDKPNPFYGNLAFVIGEYIFNKNNLVRSQGRLSYDPNGLLVLDETTLSGPANRAAYQYETY